MMRALLQAWLLVMTFWSQSGIASDCSLYFNASDKSVDWKLNGEQAEAYSTTIPCGVYQIQARVSGGEWGAVSCVLLSEQYRFAKIAVNKTGALSIQGASGKLAGWIVFSGDSSVDNLVVDGVSLPEGCRVLFVGVDKKDSPVSIVAVRTKVGSTLKCGSDSACLLLSPRRASKYDTDSPRCHVIPVAPNSAVAISGERPVRGCGLMCEGRIAPRISGEVASSGFNLVVTQADFDARRVPVLLSGVDDKGADFRIVLRFENDKPVDGRVELVSSLVRPVETPKPPERGPSPGPETPDKVDLYDSGARMLLSLASWRPSKGGAGGLGGGAAVIWGDWFVAGLDYAQMGNISSGLGEWNVVDVFIGVRRSLPLTESVGVMPFATASMTFSALNVQGAEGTTLVGLGIRLGGQVFARVGKWSEFFMFVSKVLVLTDDGGTPEEVRFGSDVGSEVILVGGGVRIQL